MVGAREDASRVRFIQHQDEYHGADRVNAVYVLAKCTKLNGPPIIFEKISAKDNS